MGHCFSGGISRGISAVSEAIPEKEQDRQQGPEQARQRHSTGQAHSDRVQRFWSGACLAQGEDSVDHSLDWINTILQTLLPHFNEALRKQLPRLITEEVNAKLEEVPGISKIAITDFDWGTSAPVLGPLKPQKKESPVGSKEAIELTIGVNWNCNCSISMQVTTALTTFSVGIKKFRFVGELSFSMGPIMDTLPVVGGVQVYMTSPPLLDWELSGGARLADMPGLAPFIRDEVMKVFRKLLVLPNRISIEPPAMSLMGGRLKIDKPTEDLAPLRFPRPECLLQLGVVEASNLTGKDFSFLGKATSDPYAIICVGNREHKTPTMERNLNPKWGDQGFGDFLVFDSRQHVQIDVFDDDAMSDDFIGRVRDAELKDIIKKKDQWLDLYEVELRENSESLAPKKAGQVRVMCDLFGLSSDPKDVLKPPKKRTAGSAFMMLQVMCLRGLAKEQCSGTKLSIEVEGKTVVSKGGKYVDVVDRQMCQATSQRLAEYLVQDGADEAEVAKISGLKLDVVRKIVQQKPSFTCRWFEGFNFVLKDVQAAELQVSMKIAGEKKDGAQVGLAHVLQLNSLLQEKDMTLATVLRLETTGVKRSKTAKDVRASTIDSRASTGVRASTIDSRASTGVRSGAMGEWRTYDLEIKLQLFGFRPYTE